MILRVKCIPSGEVLPLRVVAFFVVADCCDVRALGICVAQSGPNLLVGSAETVQRAVCSRRVAVRGLAGSLSRGSR